MRHCRSWSQGVEEFRCPSGVNPPNRQFARNDGPFSASRPIIVSLDRPKGFIIRIYDLILAALNRSPHCFQVVEALTLWFVSCGSRPYSRVSRGYRRYRRYRLFAQLLLHGTMALPLEVSVQRILQAHPPAASANSP